MGEMGKWGNGERSKPVSVAAKTKSNKAAIFLTSSFRSIYNRKHTQWRGQGGGGGGVGVGPPLGCGCEDPSFLKEAAQFTRMA